MDDLPTIGDSLGPRWAHLGYMPFQTGDLVENNTCLLLILSDGKKEGIYWYYKAYAIRWSQYKPYEGGVWTLDFTWAQIRESKVISRLTSEELGAISNP